MFSLCYIKTLMLYVIPYIYVLQKQNKKGREMFYLMMHSTHFIYMLHVVRHMVEDHSDSERKPTAATLATLSD